MSTVLIVVALIVAFVIIVAAVLYTGPGKGSGFGGRGGLKRRFGPEYDRVVDRHDGDTKAAERELTERVKRHGELRPRSLSEERREQYVAHWAGLQERFVDSPREAVTEADRLVARLAEECGYPAGTRYDDQVEALSVHHAHQVEGYRRVHEAFSPDGADADADGAGTDTGTGTGTGTGGAATTEELREAMVGARELFEQLILARPEKSGSDSDRPRDTGRDKTFSLRPKGSGV
ncbi:MULTISPECIES: hypothetical protein [unclassified Streptomyces]|uniref:hypothetical protein n=1 Tax=unclassified Streptomyces TaxID=2593676 RepID=UPI002E27AF6E|nr:hypothetical protein [Streptomyces sp. NBC_01429]